MDEANLLSNNTKNEIGNAIPKHSSFASPSTQPAKRKRNHPGNPDPEAEVVALSPNSLQATNRFVCDVCNKGFQRDQNLQLHRRGHNLPWKLKQRTDKEVKKKVYICPEPTCVHHEPSRALGDLTGIKKHYSRKHGEKKWKCEKCSKRYAVKTDWKAHFKICGTKEYRCDCGTLFSRRDSFITHRAFCDALAEESARAVTVAANPLLSSSSTTTTTTNLQTQLHHNHGGGGALYQQFPVLKTEQDHQQLQWSLPENPNSNPNNNNNASSFSSFHRPTLSSSSSHYPHMSATALLQKASQMGVTMSTKSCESETILRPHQAHMTENGFNSTDGSDCLLDLSSSREEIRNGFMMVHNLSSFGNKAATTTTTTTTTTITSGVGGVYHNNNTIDPFQSRFQESAAFEETFNNGFLIPKGSDHQVVTESAGSHLSGGGGGRGGGQDGLTRDFLGIRAFPQRDFINMGGLDHHHIGSSSPSSSSHNHHHQQNQNAPPWQ